MTSVGSIVRGGFGVLRAQPLAVAIWALLYIAAVAAMNLVMRSGLGLQVTPGANRTPAVMASATGANLLLNLFNLVLFLTLFTAAMRSVLRPSERGIGFIRFGADELREIGLGLFLLILFYAGLIVVGIILGVIFALLLAAAGTGTGMVAAFAVAIILVLALLCWLGVRLSLCFPLTLLRGAITISESWRLTRGRFWILFGGFFLLYLLVLLLTIGAAAINLSDYLAELSRGGFTLPSVQAATQSQIARQLGPIDARVVFSWIAGGVAGAIGTALLGGGAAVAARDLADVRAEMAETFA